MANTTIYKYEIPIPDDDGVSEVPMPRGAQILSVGVDPGERLVVWALVDPAKHEETKRFRVVGTGHDASRVNPGKFLGTALMPSLRLVWHVFQD